MVMVVVILWLGSGGGGGGIKSPADFPWPSTFDNNYLQRMFRAHVHYSIIMDTRCIHFQ